MSDGRVVQRHVLYLGEINASQREALRKTIEVQDAGQRRQVSLFPAGSMPCNDVDARLAGKRGIAIEANTFIARLMLHVLPAGFKRIRHYGLLAPAAKTQRLALARSLLARPADRAALASILPTGCRGPP